MKRAFLLLFALAGLSGLSAQDKEPELAIKLHAYGVELGLGLKPVTLLPGTDTILWLDGAGAYKLPNFYRNPTNDQQFGDNTGNISGVSLVYAKWQAGIAQGFVFNPVIKKNYVEGFLFYQGYVLNSSQSDPAGNLAASNRPDKGNTVQNSFLAGLSLNDLVPGDFHGLQKGYYTEFSVEFAPSQLQTVDVAFSRLNATSKIFLPLFDLDPVAKENKLSLLLGNFTQIDNLYQKGTSPLPYFAEQGFGGRNYRTGVGESVRGVEAGRFDAKFKFVNNLELRLNLPTLFVDGLIPGVSGYFDVGGYSGLPTSTAANDSGMLYSTGAGAFLSFKGVGEIALYKDFWLNGTPYKASDFRIALGLHF